MTRGIQSPAVDQDDRDALDAVETILGSARRKWQEWRDARQLIGDGHNGYEEDRGHHGGDDDDGSG